MQGRDGDIWQQYISSLPLDEMLLELSLSGFNGIYLDGYGYADGGKEQVTALASILGGQPIISANGRMYFFDMSHYNWSIKAQYTLEELKQRREQLSNLSSYEWLSTFISVAGKNINIDNLPYHGESTLFYIDRVNGKPAGNSGEAHICKYGKGRNVTLSGWAVDSESGTAAGGVYINIDSAKDIKAIYGQTRPDVGEYFKTKSYINSGFKAYLPSTVLGKGRHTLALKIISADRQSYYMPAQRIYIEVK